MRKFAALWLATILVHQSAGAFELGKDLLITGQKVMTYRRSSISGDNYTFRTDNYGQETPFDDRTNLFITGHIIPNVYLSAKIARSRWSYYERDTYFLRYETPLLDLTVGDLNISLPGNQFVTFNKSLQGIAISNVDKASKFKYTLITSETKTVPITRQFHGENRNGPYYLSPTPIVDGSEIVKVDEQIKKRGEDYIIDYLTGYIEFTSVLPIPSTSWIVVTYEHLPPGQTAGRLYGLRCETDLGKYLSVGTTYVTQVGQKAAGATTTYRRWTEGFYGSHVNPVTHQLPPLTFRPVVKVERVTIDGVIQKEKPAVPTEEPWDYLVDLRLGIIEFNKTILPNSTITVEYLYEVSQVAQGTKSLLGLDATYRIGTGSELSLQWARSLSPSASQNGSAMNLTGRASLKNFNFGLSYRNIEPSFSYIESVGFQRNERGLSFDFEYSPNEFVRLFNRYDSSQGSYGYSFGYGGGYFGSGAEVQSLQNTFGVSINSPNLPRINFTRQRMSNASGGANSVSLSNSLNLDYDWKGIKIQGNYNKSEQEYTSSLTSSPSGSGSTGSFTNASAISMSSTNLRLEAPLSEKFNLSAEYALNNSLDRIQNRLGVSRGLQLRASFELSDFLSLTANFRKSHSSGFVGYAGSFTGGFSGGQSYYWGGGFSGSSYGYRANQTERYSNQRQEGGTDSDSTSSSYLASLSRESETTIASFGLQYRPLQKLTLTADYEYQLNNNIGAGNYRTNGLTLGALYNLSDICSLNWMLMKQKMSYLDTPGDMVSDMSWITLRLGPVWNFDFDLSFQRMAVENRFSATGFGYGFGAGSFGTETRSLNARLTYRWAENRNLFGELELFSGSGYMNTNKITTRLGMEYFLNQIVSLSADYMMMNYRDLKNERNDYTASMLESQLRINF